MVCIVGSNRIVARLIPTLVALLASSVLVLTPWRTAGLALAAVALGVVGLRAARGSFTSTMPAQLVLAFGVIVAYPHPAGRITPALTVAGVSLLLLVAVQPTVNAVVNKPTLRVYNLPGYGAARPAPIDPRVLYGVTVAGIAALGAFGLARLTAAPIAAVLAANVLACGYVTLAARSARRRNERGHKRLRVALDRYAPTFAMYFSAPAHTEYHVHMWLPYLQRVGQPFVIITREAAAAKSLAASTDVPVLFCPTVSFVDQAVTPTMRACFYVNNGARNSHMVRFHQMTHIQLLHGDSDKASSFNPVTGMFDRIFVAGQAGIDRYAANGVHIPLRKFDIVGRPQVEAVEVSRDRIADIADKVVLYATTWIGLYTDANYCSLPIGEKIVAELLERKATVILRPHPYATRDASSAASLTRLMAMLADDADKTGRAHVYGPAASTEMTVFDCVNRADAMISDVSSVASDFLYSGKPFALVNMLGESLSEFEGSFPLARAAYVVDRDAANLADVLDDMLETDTLEPTRREVKTYYLGDFGEQGYSEAFVRAARRYVEAGGVPAAGG